MTRSLSRKSRYRRVEPGSFRKTVILLTGDRGFESYSLQRRINCEPDSYPPIEQCVAVRASRDCSLRSVFQRLRGLFTLPARPQRQKVSLETGSAFLGVKRHPTGTLCPKYHKTLIFLPNSFGVA